MNTFFKIAIGAAAVVVAGITIAKVVSKDEVMNEEPKPVKEVIKENVVKVVNYTVSNMDKIQRMATALSLFSVIIELVTNINKLYSVRVMNNRLKTINEKLNNQVVDTYRFAWNRAIDSVLNTMKNNDVIQFLDDEDKLLGRFNIKEVC